MGVPSAAAKLIMKSIMIIFNEKPGKEKVDGKVVLDYFGKSKTVFKKEPKKVLEKQLDIAKNKKQTIS